MGAALLMTTNLRKEAEGVACMARLPSVCNFDRSTTVLCHIRKAGDGIARKPSDLNAFIGCSACHDVQEGRVKHLIADHIDFDRWVHEAHMRTLDYWIDTGLVKL